MKLVIYEMYKLWTQKIFIIYLLVLILLNFFLIWMYSSNDEASFPSEAYRCMAKELKEIELSEQYKLI